MVNTERYAQYDPQANLERIRTAIALETPDQVPVFLHATGPFIAGQAGVPLKDYFHDSALMTEAQSRLHRRFDGLSAYMPDLGPAPEASALGADITFTDDGVAWVNEFVESEADLERLKLPDVEQAGYMTRMLHHYRHMRARVAADVPVYFYSVMSPWAVAALIRGVNQLMTDVIADPDFVHRLVRITTAMEIKWLRAMQQEVPPRFFDRILLNDDLAAFVSLEQFREFILPSYQEVYNAFPGCQRWYHNDADTSGILEGIAEAGIQCFHFGYQVDPHRIKAVIGGRVCLMGSIPPLQVLREGTPEDVDAAVKAIIQAIGTDGGLIVAAGGYLSEGTPLENLDAMIRACERYGRRDRFPAGAPLPWQKAYRIAREEADDAAVKKPALPADRSAAPADGSPLLVRLRDALLEGDFPGIAAVVQQALDEGHEARMLLHTVMIPALEEVGRRFSAGTIFIPEMMVSAKAMEAGLEVLNPVLATGGDIAGTGRVAIGTVKNDLHDIGKNIVVTMLQGSGFEVEDLGVDCPAERFVAAVENGADIIGMSAILTTTLPQMERVIRLLEEKGLRERVCVLVGGAAVTRSFAERIGADAYCADAAEGAQRARAFMDPRGHAIS